MEQRKPSRGEGGEEEELDDSRTSMPALARPCTSGVETSKHMQVTCWHCGCWDHYECVDNQYLSPYRQVAALVSKKKQALYIQI